MTSLGRHDSAEACWAACNATTQHACKQWVWHSPHFGDGGKWARACFQVRRWPPLIVPDEHVISGVLYAAPVWRATGCARLHRPRVSPTQPAAARVRLRLEADVAPWCAPVVADGWHTDEYARDLANKRSLQRREARRPAAFRSDASPAALAEP